MTTNKNNITQVWYEIELNSRELSEQTIAMDLWLNFNTFKKIKWHSLMIKMSKEYYGSTIEFNFIKENFTKNLHKKIKKFTTDVMKKYSLTVYWNSPSFVWTHIHFFRSPLSNIEPDIILKIVMQFVLDNIDDLHIQSLERLICSHQLWWNYVHSNPIIKDILSSELWKWFAYPDQSRTRPKYRPVIHSPRSTTWKLRSTEIRFIPTEYIVNDKVLDLFDRLNSMSPMPNKDIPTLYTILITHYKWLLWIKNKPASQENPTSPQTERVVWF